MSMIEIAVDPAVAGDPAVPVDDQASGDSAPVDPAELEAATALFHALSEPARLAILQHLTLGEHRVRDLTDHLGLAQSTVSAHLACLRECGLVTSRPHGRASLFSLSAPAELLVVLAAAERLLAATGHRVALCATVSRSMSTTETAAATATDAAAGVDASTPHDGDV